jgi:ubiquinone/menaquinone biosynthesis C-methylase UbiE
MYKKINSTNIYFFGLRLGLKTLIKKRKVTSRILEIILIPVAFWRCIENIVVFNDLQIKKTDKVLDIGSPKILSLFIAKHIGATVYATDVFDYFLEYCKSFADVLGVLDKNYFTHIEDGTKLKFKKNFFDKIFSVSVIEHIPRNGDTKAIKEMSRVLKPGGKLAITIPCGTQFVSEYRPGKKFYYSVEGKVSKKVFYQRIYSEKEIFKRIIAPSGLNLLKINYFGERIKPFGKPLFKFFPVWTGPLHPFLSFIFNTNVGRDIIQVGKFGMAEIILEKTK